ncbi:MAG: isoamylase, partial [Spirochaetaceae bacterium]|nr:isoamylase [Spirochaetaceae bacterium]
MKKYTALTFLLVIIGTYTGALDTASSGFADHLITLSGPAAPEIFEDGVLFTFSPEYRSVGIAFAHEQFTRIHWFQKLLTLEDQGPPPPSGRQFTPRYNEVKVLFYAYTPPPEVRSLEYRLVINGLWTTDPLNPLHRADGESGLIHSVVFLPEPERPPVISGALPGLLSLNYAAPSGETVTVAGDFNGWDPFMYELRETAPGRYSLAIPLPPGTYHYVF